MRDAIKAQLIQDGLVGEDAVVVIAGLANGYADYTVTYEEFQQQRYEGGSTIFGPHQLNAYIQEFKKLATAMAHNQTVTSHAAPADFSDTLIDMSKSPSTDHLPSGAKAFGDVLVDAGDSYKQGDVVTVEFAGANAWNLPFKQNETWCEVLKCLNDDCSQSEVIAVDGDWETRLTVVKSTVNLVETARTWRIQWYTPTDTAAGTYRIAHYGTSCDNPLIGSTKYTAYHGISKTFTITA